ncbi:hypothetical protein MEQU1_001551 [Malassezia equina]|uniref:Metal resistance protein YCF1 n=1 Tax=Malassezia equina TaxID=1381935 RepID=A0AAF0EDA0_9BASI|nr:hypothetical protein MEQU1_001551 [Malassezia equina]
MADLGAWVPGFGSSFWFETPVHVYDAAAQPVHTGMRVLSLLCDSAEGWGPMSPTRDFDLTPCFQALVLWLLPAVAFCAVAVASLPRWLQCERSPRSDNSLHLLHEKDGVAGAIAVLGFVEFVVLIGLRSHVDGSASALTGGVQVLATGAMSVAYIAAFVLQHTMHWRARHGSDAAILLWSLHMITGPIRLRTVLQLAEPGSVMQLLTVIPLCMRLLFVLIALFLECCPVEIDDGITLPDDDNALLAEEDVADTTGEDLDAPPQESPVETANLFSRLVFHWMQPLMSLGAKRYLTEADMYALPHGEDTERLSDAFQTRWIASAQAAIEQGRTLYDTGRMRFWKTLLGAFGRPFMIAAIFKVMQDVLAFVQPQLLRSLLAFVGRWETEEEVAKRGTPLRGFVLVALLFLTAMLQTMSLHQYFQLVSIAGMRARAGIVSAIFRKSLRLSNQERGDRRTGDVVNLMSVDANRLPDFIMYAHILWSAVFQITMAFVSLHNLLGWSAFVGVAIMVVSVPLNTALAHYLRQLSAQQMKVRDRRTGLMNEIVLNIKSIKLFAWEEAFTRRLLKVRNEEELPLLRNIGVASAGFNFFWQAIPFFVSLGTFITFSATSSQPLTADIVFPALSLYQLLNFPLSMLAGIVSMFLQTQVSAERLASFFDAEELDARARRVKAGVPPPGGEAIRFRGASLAWSLEEPITPTLRDVDLTIRRGELVALLGRVGDGKTSLLSAMLGDMVRLRGRVTVQGDVAYFSQGGWCMGATVRDNILFGRAYEEAHYQRCLEACALGPDLAILEHGDLTEIGERGVSLSGGQRARVALARACYASADIYLLDDPLAAVDAHVGAHLWEHVLGPRGMLRDKTRVLTLNAVSYLPQCDKIVTLRQGALLPEQGTFDEVMAMKGDVYRVITSLRSDDDETQAQEQQEAQAAHAPSPPADVSRPRTLDKAELKRATLRHLRESQAPKELQETGSVQWRVYQRYIHSASSVGVLLFFVAHIVTQAFSVARDVVLKQWSAANAQPGATEDAHVARHYLTLYALMGLLTSVGVCVAPMILYVWLVLSSARRFHDGLFLSVLRYPLQWFETTPTGRLLNLFSRDISVIDEVLPRVIQGMTRSSVVVLGVVCVVTYSVPAFLLAVVPLAMAYRAVMRYYLASSRELKRIDAVTKSPIFTWFQEALGGLTTIRAFGQAHAFTDAFEARVDRNQMCYFPAVTCNRWLAVRIECLGSVVILLASTLAVIMVVTGGRMSAGLLGLMLSQALSTTQTLNWAVRSASEVEQNIVSVERVLSYAGLPQERAYTIEATAPAAEWPARGEVEFRDYSTRYREGLDLVLRHISFSTRPGERIGVCGRTGAGKSSLTLALFRILEAESGSIWIDGVDISTLGLHELRQAMAIIPQDPQLWHGTLRQNLDPLVHYSDTELYRALEQARLAHLVDDHEEGLGRSVAEGGANFSAGQRQLICIARALVRQSRILVLDEATSSIDLETDALIQQIVRQEFSGTSITIAHRLATIMDSDRVLVLSQGEVAEFDTPANLLDQPSSLFYSLAKESGLVDRRRSYVSAS